MLSLRVMDLGTGLRVERTGRVERVMEVRLDMEKVMMKVRLELRTELRIGVREEVQVSWGKRASE